eukprot:758141-Hanusia_phi.AAC.1
MCPSTSSYEQVTRPDVAPPAGAHLEFFLQPPVIFFEPSDIRGVKTPEGRKQGDKSYFISL